MKFSKEKIDEVSPKGWEKTVKAMKKHKEIDNPYALANYMKAKGYKSRKESVDNPEYDEDNEDMNIGEAKVGDTVHLGHGTKGGSGVTGKVVKVDGKK